MRLAAIGDLVGLVLLALILVGCSEQGPDSQAATARALVAKKDYRSAVITLKSAIQKQPNAADLRYLLGKSLYELGSVSPGLVELNKARELGHPEEQIVPMLVRAMVTAGEAQTVVERFGKARFDSSADQAELLVSMAAAYSSLGQSKRAREVILEALKLNPKHGEARLLEAHFLAGEGKFDAASELVEGLIRENPEGDAGAWYLKGLLQRYAKSDPQGALQSQRKCLTTDPRNVLAHTEALSILYAANDRKGMREQMAVMQAALPANLNTLLFRAQLELLDGNLKSSRDLLQQLMRTKAKSVRVLMLAAQIEMRLGSLALAETYLNNALQLRGTHADVRHMLASVHVRQGQSEKALRVLQPLLESERPDATALALAGEALLHAGNLAKAQNLFDLASKVRPDDQRLRATVALSHMAQGKFEQGISELESVAAVDKDTFADLALVSSNIRRNNLPAALRAIDRLEAKAPGKPLPHLLRGQVRLAMKDEASARLSFSKALEADPTYVPAATALSAMDVGANRLAAAKSHFEGVLAKDPRNLVALLSLAELRRRNQEPPDTITALLVDAVAKNPTELQARVALAENYLALKANKTAATAAQEGLALFPDAAPLLDVLGRSQFLLQEYQQALSTFRKLATVLPTSAVSHMRVAEVYVAQRDLASAKQSLRRALEVAPNYFPAQTQLFALNLADQGYREAMALAKDVQRSQPTTGTGLGMEGQLLEAQKNFAGAIAAYRGSLARSASAPAAIGLHRSLAASGDLSGAQRHEREWRERNPNDVQFISYVAGTASQAKDWARAEDLYRLVLRLTPNNLEASNNLAWALMKQKKSGAVELAARAVQLAPSDAGVLDTYANALLSEGKVAEGLKNAEEALRINTTLNEARLTVARAALMAGDKARAKKELESLLYLGDKFPEQTEVADLLRTLP